MENNSANWLPHLTSEIVSDARGPELDAFVVALEGWRRGLSLRWHTKDSEKFTEIKTWFVDRPGKLFSLSSEEKTHYFFRTRGDKVSNEAVEIGADKEETKKYLIQAGVRVPEGKQFNSGAPLDDMVQFAETIGYPVVVKPTDGSFGRGVVTNINDKDQLGQAIDYIRNEQYAEIMIERHIPGKDYRLYVVGDHVVGAMLRTPPNVVGDGVSTIAALIERKNELRKQNPRLISCLIIVDEELKNYISSNGYTLESVPAKGEHLLLSTKSNISIGGDPIDVFDSIEEEIKEAAIQSIKAIPNLFHGAVDVIVEEGQALEKATVVLEINPTAQIGSLLFPMEGKARDIPAAIIDYYFPETKGVVTEKHKVFFDFPDVLDPLSTKVASVTTVSSAPVGTLYSKKYTLTGEVQGIDFHRGLRKQAFERHLSGFVKNLNDGSIEVVVLGSDEEAVNLYREALLSDPERSEIESIEESIWTGPVKVGFEVKADLKTQVEQLKEMKKQMDLLQRELKITEKQFRQYTKSFSWQMTWPFRKLSDVVKFIVRSLRR